MYISSEVADRIKRLAKEQGVQLKQMLSDIGLAASTMANMRASMLKADSLAKIADYLGTSVDYLLGRSDSAEKSSSVSEEDQQLLSSFHKLDEKDQYKALGYIDSLLSAEKYLPKDGFKNA